MDSLLAAKGPKTRAANPGSIPGRLPKVLPGVLPRVSSELPSPGGGKELTVADSIMHISSLVPFFFCDDYK